MDLLHLGYCEHPRGDVTDYTCGEHPRHLICPVCLEADEYEQEIYNSTLPGYADYDYDPEND